MTRSIVNRIDKIEKTLDPCVKGRRYVDIWMLPEEQWAKHVEWALGNTDTCPDFWPSEERAVELRKQGYIIETRNEIRQIIEECIKLNQEVEKAGIGIDFGN